MKTFAKLSLVAAVAAALGSSAALADDPQLQNRLAVQRAQAANEQRATTVAVYAADRGVGRSASRADERNAGTRLELRSNAHGQTYGIFAPER
jgi:hypothetical protein